MALLSHSAVLTRMSVAVAAVLAVAGAASAQSTQDEALAAAFPSAEVERHTAYLSEAQIVEARRLAGEGVDLETTVVTYYLARDAAVGDAASGEGLAGVAYFDAHPVRTLPEVLMIVVGPDDRIARIETVAFREPPEYESPEGWLALFEGQELDRGLARKGDIPNIAGATLTADAVIEAARRVLALHRVIDPFARAVAGEATR